MGALDGLRVLDLTRLLPGGYCTLLLADHGADVVKVEDTGAGDYARADAAAFAALNRGKRSLSVDLKSAGGRDAFLRLARDADVVVESFRPGVMDRLGVGFSQLRAVNSTLVYCAITGYGQAGPLAGRAGHDLNYLARAGVLGLSGEADGPPVQSAAQIADLAGGALTAAFGILAALRSGTAQFVDVAMADGALSLLAMPAAGFLAGGAVPRRGSLVLGGGVVCYRPYACADGWVSLAALEPKFWAAFCAGVGRDDLVPHQFDPVGSPAWSAVAAILAGRTRAEWEAFNVEHDCCLEPVLELDEALAAAPGMVVDGGLATPVRLSDAPARAAASPPGLGEHTDAVLREAGLDDADVLALRAAGAVR
ncbi:MAG TPA: CaiB/BaiF CoA-transferase family protein [Solirubrobacter sp.]|nr:CaiB/BaiF CoA-transferase family protein [Solirubrobacter sp.]